MDQRNQFNSIANKMSSFLIRKNEFETLIQQHISCINSKHNVNEAIVNDPIPNELRRCHSRNDNTNDQVSLVFQNNSVFDHLEHFNISNIGMQRLMNPNDPLNVNASSPASATINHTFFKFKNLNNEPHCYLFDRHYSGNIPSIN